MGPALWIRIQTGFVFSNFVDPDPHRWKQIRGKRCRIKEKKLTIQRLKLLHFFPSKLFITFVFKTDNITLGSGFKINVTGSTTPRGPDAFDSRRSKYLTRRKGRPYSRHEWLKFRPRTSWFFSISKFWKSKLRLPLPPGLYVAEGYHSFRFFSFKQNSGWTQYNRRWNNLPPSAEEKSFESQACACWGW